MQKDPSYYIQGVLDNNRLMLARTITRITSYNVCYTKLLRLEGITVLEFAQFMAGPSAGLKMADLGARVIKIERPGSGEAGRQIALKNIYIDESSMVFHTANRNKLSFGADLKDPNDLAKVKQLIAQADVMTHNFRPGVMEKIGLDYDTVASINPRIIYGVVSGYSSYNFV